MPKSCLATPGAGVKSFAVVKMYACSLAEETVARKGVKIEYIGCAQSGQMRAPSFQMEPKKYHSARAYSYNSSQHCCRIELVPSVASGSGAHSV